MRTPTLYVVFVQHANGAGLLLDPTRKFAPAFTRKDDAVAWAASQGYAKAYFAPLGVKIPLDANYATGDSVQPKEGT